MKLIGVTLLLIGFAVTIDAKAVREVLNGGRILSPDGKYIPGEFGIEIILL